jgi:hypothetical protein
VAQVNAKRLNGHRQIRPIENAAAKYSTHKGSGQWQMKRTTRVAVSPRGWIMGRIRCVPWSSMSASNNHSRHHLPDITLLSLTNY